MFPFVVVNVFFSIYGTNPEMSREVSTCIMITKQHRIAVNGSCKITLDDGKEDKHL